MRTVVPLSMLLNSENGNLTMSSPRMIHSKTEWEASRQNLTTGSPMRANHASLSVEVELDRKIGDVAGPSSARHQTCDVGSQILRKSRHNAKRSTWFYSTLLRPANEQGRRPSCWQTVTAGAGRRHQGLKRQSGRMLWCESKVIGAKHQTRTKTSFSKSIPSEPCIPA
jgi:hypothetical protein